jgi:Chaperone of endosialidase
MNRIVHAAMGVIVVGLVVLRSTDASAQSCGSNGSVGACDNATTSVADAYGVYGQNTNSGTNNAGVWGASTNGTGVYATGGAYGVYGSGTTAGAYGGSTNGYGVYGDSSSLYGVFGTSSSSDGVHGAVSNNYSAVAGLNTGGGTGVYASANSGDGVYAISSTGWAGYFSGTVNVTTGLQVAGTCISGTCSSDERLKKNIRPLEGALDDVIRLRPVMFEWKDPTARGHSEKPQMGFIAQDVEKVRPDWVSTDDQGYKAINMDRLPVMLVASVRTLKAENDSLRERIEALESKRAASSGPSWLGWNGPSGLLGGALLGALGMLVVARRKQRPSRLPHVTAEQV